MQKLTNKKIIFIDIDGTLLDETGSIPPSAIDAIHLAQMNKHLVFICTGRCKAEITQDILDIGFDGIVAASGAYLEVNGTVLQNITLSNTHINQIEEALKNNGVYYWYEGSSGVYAHPGTKDSLYQSLEHLIQKHQSHKNKFTKNFTPFIDRVIETDMMYREDINKCTFDAHGLKYESIQKVLEQTFDLTPCSFGLICGAGGEITLKDINKATGINDILNYLQLEHDATVAYGDSGNDYEALKFVHLGVAMGNSQLLLFEVADDVTDTPANDGLYKSFKKHGFI